jgi:hypothetical protein
MKIYNSKSKRVYPNILDIDKEDYEFIHFITNAKTELFVNLKSISPALKLSNLSHIKFLVSAGELVQLFKTGEFNYSNLIANFQRLSTIMFYDGNYIRDITSISRKNLFYYLDVNGLLIIVKDEDIEIPSNILNLNIICYFQTQLVDNLPKNIRHLHLTFANQNIFYHLTNLPIELETLSISLILNSSLPDEIFYEKTQEIMSKIKLPFGCKLNVIPIVHNQK